MKEHSGLSVPVHEPGQVIAERYVVEQRFEGGMGYVYIALDRSQNLRFAIKQPKAWMLAEPALLARVAREADAWTGLGMHPHIAYCYFVRTLDGVPHIFVEYVDGGNLREWITTGRCMDYRVGLDLAIQCCQGMERAHGWGMVHRDLKPENILVSCDGQAKITDFGLVGDLGIREGTAGMDRAGMSAPGTQLGMQMGTPAYMAPEQWRDPRRRSATAPDGVDSDSDVYSFGVCLWEMICGRLPYPSALTDAELPDPHRSRRDLPASLGQLLKQVVDRDRRRRPADFGVLRKRLNAVHRELFGDDAPGYRLELPDTTTAELNNQGYSYAELGKSEQALACFRQAVEKDPTQPQAVYNLALWQWRAAEIDDLEVLRRLQDCERNPRNAPETLAELTALIHAERADWEAAQARLQDYPGRFAALFGDREVKPRCLRTLTGHTHFVHAVAVMGDGRRALSGSWDKTLKLWDLDTGECLRTLTGHTDWVYAVAVAGDGRRALSGSKDQTLRLWDLETGECLRTLTGHTGEVKAVVVTSDGRRALSGSTDKTLKLWDLNTGACLQTLNGHTQEVGTVAVTSDGWQALSGGNDRTLKLWNLETGACLRTLTEATAGYTVVAMTGDGRYALLGGYSRIPRLLDLETGACLRTLTGHTGWWTKAVTVTSDGRQALSSGDDNTLKLWDLTSGRCLYTLELTAWGLSVAVTSDGQRALVGINDLRINLKLWDLPPITYQAALQLTPARSFAERHQAHVVLQQALAQTDAYLAQGDFRGAYTTLLAAWEEIGFRPDAAIQERYNRLTHRGRLAALKTVYPVKTFKNQLFIKAVPMNGVGRRAQSESDGHTLKFWDFDSDTYWRALNRQEAWICAVAVTDDGRRRALSTSFGNFLKLWDLETGKSLRTLTGHTKYPTALAMTGDGRWGLSGSWDQTLKLWDLETGDCLRTLTEHTGPVLAVAVTGDGRRALSGSWDQTLKLWDLETGECLRTLSGHTYHIKAVAVTGDGRRALSGGDHTLKLWDLETGECLRTLADGGLMNSVEAVAMTGDGRRALSGSRDHTLKLWDLETGECLQTLTGHTHEVNAVAVTAGGQQALSGSRADSTLILWQLIWELEFPDERLPGNASEEPREELRQAISLQKGHRLSLSKAAPNLKKVFIGLGWNLHAPDGVEFDIDASAFLLGADGKARSDADVVFYNQLQSACGSVRLPGDNRADPGPNSDDEVIIVDLARVPAEVRKITFTVTLHEADRRRQNFSQVRNAYIRVVNAETDQEIARYDLDGDATTETALIFGELYRYEDEWRFSAVGQGYADGLAALCRRYGIDV